MTTVRESQDCLREHRLGTVVNRTGLRNRRRRAQDLRLRFSRPVAAEPTIAGGSERRIPSPAAGHVLNAADELARSYLSGAPRVDDWPPLSITRTPTARTDGVVIQQVTWLAARGKSPCCIRRAMHPARDGAGPFLSGVEYGQYAPSSRLVRAVRGIVTTPSRCDAGFHHGLLGHHLGRGQFSFGELAYSMRSASPYRVPPRSACTVSLRGNPP